MKTYSPKAKEITRVWHVIDAANIPLGRLASRVAQLLRGKHKPTFAPHLDTGDHVVVVNAEQIALTGDKINQKMYYRHSGYPGGFRATPIKDELARRPIRVIERAVKGMLPHTALGKQQLTKLKVYPGPDHPHAGQVNPGPGKAKTRRLSPGAAPADVTEATATEVTATDAPESSVTSRSVTWSEATAALAAAPTTSRAPASESSVAEVSERQAAAAATDREEAEAANPTDAPLGEPTEAGSTPTESTPGDGDATDDDDVRAEAGGSRAATARGNEEATS